MNTTAHSPQFTASKYERSLINKIADRAIARAAEIGVKYDKTDALMDIEACHCNGCCLDLEKLLKAKADTFGHDVFGIRRFIDRSTGELTDCFLPRCAMPDPTCK